MQEIRSNFLTRRFIDNVFKHKVEQCVVEINRMRNSIVRRDRKIRETGSCTDAVWDKSDLFTAQGTIFALAYLLLRKLED